jgi:agmatinase
LSEGEAPVFLDAEVGRSPKAQVTVLPVPYERTTSYGQGTADGPRALLAASLQVELYDEELDSEPFRLGLDTAAPCAPAAAEPQEALAEIEQHAHRHLAAGRFLLTVGGEHGLTLAPVRAARRVYGEALGVLQFDAHADLRDAYGGNPYSHASVMRRILEEGLPTAAVGLRALSTPEARLITQRGLPVLWAHQMAAEPGAVVGRFDELLDALPERVYLTFDIDYFDPSLVPATGTPEPGGGTWWPTLALLRRLFERKTVVAMDLVELAPIPGQTASDFVAARLAYKCLAYLQASGRWPAAGD